jgi:formiminotetrahydrofolate cyclodeaminase
MNKIKNLKIGAFLEDLSSSAPTPGGGATAALAGAMAASLVEMVANLTIGKAKYEKVQKEVRILAGKAAKHKEILLKLADEDVKAFNQVMSAYKSKDQRKIKKALMYATEVPTKVALVSQGVRTLALKIARIGNKNAYSDAKSALHLTEAAVKSAQENIKINKKILAGLK